MKKLLLVTCLALGTGSGAVAQTMAPSPSLNAKIAQTFGTHFSNGRATTMHTSDGMVMTKITVPTADMAMLKSIMNNGHNSCMVAEIEPGETNTAVIVCGGNQP